MKSDSNTESDEKMKSDSNTESDERMKSDSTTYSDTKKKKMSDSNTRDSEEKKDTVPELKSTEAVAKEKGLTPEVPENLRPSIYKSSHSLRSSSNGTGKDVMDMDVVPTKVAGLKRKRNEKISNAEVVNGSVKADIEEACKKCKVRKHDDEADKDEKNMKIKLESIVSEDILKTGMIAGTYGNVPVMVKIIPVNKEGFDTISNILPFCENENIGRVYAVEQDERYIYVAYEKCDYKLDEYIVNAKPTRAELLNLLRGVVRGLLHLSTRVISHGNIRPSNIWIKQSEDSLTAKICGLDTCRQMNEGDDTRVDMHALGITFLASITYDPGLVNLNSEDQQARINTKLTNLITNDFEAYDVVSKLLKYKLYQSFTFKSVYLHSIFWRWDRRLNFLVDSCELIKMLKRDNKNSKILKEINSLGNVLSTKNWTKCVDQTWYGLMTKSNRYTYTDDVDSLLKMIRNSSNHILEIDWEEWDKEMMQNHIDELYPSLVMHIHTVLRIKLFFSKNKLLQVYFPL